jgi:lysophospholipase
MDSFATSNDKGLSMNFSLTETYSKTGYFPSKDQVSLFFRHYSVKKPVASVLLVHGFGEHSARYFHVIESLRKEGFEVFCIDLRGHGHSEGSRGDIESFCGYEEDVLSGLKQLQENKTAEKIFVIAHSMGALATIRAITKAKIEIEGLVLSSPLFALKMPMPIWKKWASFAAASILPRMRLKTGIKGRQLSADEDIVKAYDSDPLVLKTLSLRTFKEIYKSCEHASSIVYPIKPSLLLQVAGSDPVVDSNASLDWFKRINKSHEDATMKMYPGFLHEIYNETNRREAIKDFLVWLKQRV